MRTLIVLSYLLKATVLVGAAVPIPKAPKVNKPDSAPDNVPPPVPAQYPGSGSGSGSSSGSSGTNMHNSDLGGSLADVVQVIQQIADVDAPTSVDTDNAEKATITSAPKHLPSQAAACLSANSIYKSCSSKNSDSRLGFNEWPKSDHAQCLCYHTISSSVWQSIPSSFDGYMSSCNAYLHASVKTQGSASIYRTGISMEMDLCQRASNVRASTSTAPVRIATAAATAPAVQAETTGTGSLHRNHSWAWLGFGTVLIGVLVG